MRTGSRPPSTRMPGTGQPNDVSAIAVRGNDIYLGGNFTTIGGQPRNLIAKVSKDGTLDPTFNPNATGGNLPGVADDRRDEHRRLGRRRLLLDRRPAAARPRAGSIRSPARSTAGGSPSTRIPLDGISCEPRARAPGVRRRGLRGAASSRRSAAGRATRSPRSRATTGDVDVQFDANVSGGSNVGPNVFDIVLARATLFVGGDFSIIGGAARNNVATLNPRTGDEVTGFNPNVTGGSRPRSTRSRSPPTRSSSAAASLAVGGEAQGQIARLTKTGALTAFDPKIRDLRGAVLALATSDTTLYAGGCSSRWPGARGRGTRSSRRARRRSRSTLATRPARRAWCSRSTACRSGPPSRSNGPARTTGQACATTASSCPRTAGRSRPG